MNVNHLVKFLRGVSVVFLPIGLETSTSFNSTHTTVTFNN